MSHIYDGDRKVNDDREKAEILNRTFASKFSDPSVTELPPVTAYQLDPLRSFHVSEDTVRHALGNLSPYKACGPDNVSARVIRECAAELSVPVTLLCRLSLEQGVFPRVWKRANVVPIHKKKGLRQALTTTGQCLFYLCLVKSWSGSFLLSFLIT